MVYLSTTFRKPDIYERCDVMKLKDNTKVWIREIATCVYIFISVIAILGLVYTATTDIECEKVEEIE